MRASIRASFVLLACLVTLGIASPARAQDAHGDAPTHAQPNATHAAQAGDMHETGAHGGDDGHDAGHETVGAIPTVKQGLITAITSIVVFLLVLSILGTTVWPKIVKALDDRAAKIREEIEAAEAARRQAKEALEEYERSLAEARAESQKMLEQAKAQQQKLAAELRAKTDQEIAELRSRAMRDIEAARKSAVTELYEESAQLASHIASKILQREISPEDQRRLVEEALAELRSAGNGALRV